MAEQYIEAYRGYCWTVHSLADLKLAPFHLLASERAVHADKDHVWHMATLGRLCAADTVLERGGYPAVCIDSRTDVFRLLSGSRVLGIVSAVRNVDGTDLHTWLSQHFPYLIQRVVLAGSASSEKPRAKIGPFGWPFVQQPFHPRRLLSVIGRVIGEPPMTERILVVDDDEPIREILAHMLGLSGYRCRSVAGGGQALQLLDSGETFDLVTSDLMNAPLDGVSFLEQIKSKFPEIPVLMITAVHDISVALECIRNGAYDYLLKPFEREQLIFAVRRALEYRRLKLKNRELQAQVKKLAKQKSVSRVRK
jgi:CheY-like chemotaxis protein